MSFLNIRFLQSAGDAVIHYETIQVTAGETCQLFVEVALALLSLSGKVVQCF